VVAYSTLSQLGYMTVALGASAYSVAVFHLMTHAFFKALLFLAAGSVIIGVHHNQDIRWMGGLRKYMPITWITSLLGSLALIGTPLFAGFYSKDSIIEAVHFSNLPGAGFAYWAVLIGVFVTAFYSFRMYFLVFHGKERFNQNPDAHHAHHSDEEPDVQHHDDHGHHEPHESPWVVTAPLLLLAFPSVVIGFLTIGPMLFGDFFKDSIVVDAARHPAMAELAKIYHGPAQMVLHAFSTPVLYLAVAGVGLAYYMYMVNTALPAKIAAMFRPVYQLLDNKYYMDWINENVLARATRGLGIGLWKGGDQAVIDGAMVNGSARVVGLFAGVVRRVQTGYIYHYALAMILGVFILMTWFVWIGR
jgi:NADH-quinone oxidoreductase subunit L